MRLPATAKWILLALAGLAIAIGVAIAAANLTSQQIGIANESVSAGDSLAPALQVSPEASPQRRSGDHGRPDEEPTTAVPAPPSTTGEEPRFEEPATPSEESPSTPQGGGEDHGRHDGDD